MESEMKEVSKELQHHETRTAPDDEKQQQQKRHEVEVRERGENSAASAALHYNVAAAEQPKGDNSVADDRHRGSPTSAEDSDAVVTSAGKKRTKKGRVWKKNRGKQKSSTPDEAAQAELHSICVEDPPPPPHEITTTPSMATNTATPAPAAQEVVHKKPENEDDDRGITNGLEVQTDSSADSPSPQVDHQSGSQVAGSTEPLEDILDFEEEQMHQIEAGYSAASSRSTLEWGLCGEDEREPPVRTPPRTPPLREPPGKNKQQGQGQGREQAPPPGQNQQIQSPREREPWKRKPSESRGGRHESMRSSSVSQPQNPAVTIDAQKLEGMSEWNRIKAMQHSAAAEVASHKNWVPRKGIQRGSEGGDQNKGRGKGKQGRGELASQHNHHTKELARLKFEADLRIKQEELLQRSKQSMKAEIQKLKRLEATRKGRDELEMEVERNLVYLDGELIYLNQ